MGKWALYDPFKDKDKGQTIYRLLGLAFKDPFYRVIKKFYEIIQLSIFPRRSEWIDMEKPIWLQECTYIFFLPKWSWCQCLVFTFNGNVANTVVHGIVYFRHNKWHVTLFVQFPIFPQFSQDLLDFLSLSPHRHFFLLWGIFLYVSEHVCY